MKEQRVKAGACRIYSGSTNKGEFPDQFQLYIPTKYASVGYGEAMVITELSEVNNLIDVLTEWRDTVDHEQAAESGDMNVAVS